MTVGEFLEAIQSDPRYAGQMVHIHEQPAREARYIEDDSLPSPYLREAVHRLGIRRLYSHQGEAVRLAAEGKDVLVATGTASGKSLCYILPILSCLNTDPQAKAMLLFPTKALTQDQHKNFRGFLEALDCSGILCGVYDGDTPQALRRRLRDGASVIFSNPDMLHAGILAQHSRWANFLADLRILVIDELHVYSGIFGSNVALLLRRFRRICRHYGSDPQVIGCTATVGNPLELATQLVGRDFVLVDQDGSPMGKKTFVFWNPPRIKKGHWGTRRSANVEAHELMAKLIESGFPTITFSKSKMTAETIYRYLCDALRQRAPELVRKVAPYRGGYRPQERREIEKQLFNRELLGVSTTPALELGIDVGSLDACIVVGYPGTRSSFFQQTGRAGRKERESLVFLVAVDSSINQYIMSTPDYILAGNPEDGVVDPENPFIGIGHMRCAAYELPLLEEETLQFGPHGRTVLRVLEENQKLTKVRDRWYYGVSEVPQHEISLRSYSDATLVIQNVEDGAVIGEAYQFDAPPLLHPGAVYMHRGDTYLVVDLDLRKKVALVRRQEVDYYTQPLGGTDIHHIDHRLREKPFGSGRAYWGEVTAYFKTDGYEKIHFYGMDPVSQQSVELPTMVLETMAFWIVPPEELLKELVEAEMEPYSGLRAIGYATRMLLPLFIRCDTLDLSHTVGSVNSPWQAVFIYERYPHGLGFTDKAYDALHRIMPAVLDSIRACPCEKGCPCCVGKPLRKYRRYDIQKGEGSIPSKDAAVVILEGLLGDGTGLDTVDDYALTSAQQAEDPALEASLRRRLERMREPQLFHRITPDAEVKTGYPAPEREETLREGDSGKRRDRRRQFDVELQRRIAQRISREELAPRKRGKALPEGIRRTGGVVRPDDFPGRPDDVQHNADRPVQSGDALAAKARKLYKKKKRK
jgi:DEAD/DEAH box helicase domain-containing protein